MGKKRVHQGIIAVFGVPAGVRGKYGNCAVPHQRIFMAQKCGKVIKILIKPVALPALRRDSIGIGTGGLGGLGGQTRSQFFTMGHVIPSRKVVYFKKMSRQSRYSTGAFTMTTSSSIDENSAEARRSSDVRRIGCPARQKQQSPRGKPDLPRCPASLRLSIQQIADSAAQIAGPKSARERSGYHHFDCKQPCGSDLVDKIFDDSIPFYFLLSYHVLFRV
ncbi:hypothetical protein SDC9_54580 [bioreactor metagenome]|uniref:Uncharacterized protein n=1 Tax=bioreactor metagenome TaxID=1076179 RepID=A0A644WXQ4_9ZZZZ